MKSSSWGAHMSNWSSGSWKKRCLPCKHERQTIGFTYIKDESIGKYYWLEIDSKANLWRVCLFLSRFRCHRYWWWFLFGWGAISKCTDSFPVIGCFMEEANNELSQGPSQGFYITGIITWGIIGSIKSNKWCLWALSLSNDVILHRQRWLLLSTSIIESFALQLSAHWFVHIHVDDIW